MGIIGNKIVKESRGDDRSLGDTGVDGSEGG